MEYTENNNKACPICHQVVLPQYYYCPNCGNNLREEIKPVPVIIQIGIYALAIFLPPLGLWPGIKFVMKKNKQAKWVGAAAILLTLASSAVTIWAIFAIFNSYLAQMNDMLYGL